MSKIGDEAGLEAEIKWLKEQVESWKGAHSVAAADRDILKRLCARAADALEIWMPTLGSPTTSILIAELRKAAE